MLSAITLGVTRSFFPHIDSYKPYFEKWASDALHQSVKIGKVQAEWKGLHPVVSMDNVDILSDNSTLPLLHIQRLQVGANVINSLLQRRLVPSSIAVLGTRMRVHRIDANTLEVNGISLPIKANEASKIDVGEVIAWLLNQGQIRLEEVDLNWEDQSGRLFQITHLTAILSNKFSKHQVIGTATLLAATPTRFRFVANIKKEGSQVDQIRAECFLFIKNLDLTPWIKETPLYGVQIEQATLNRLRLWAVWDNSQWQQFQALFRLEQTIFSTEHLKKPFHVDQLFANAVWQRQPDGFSFAADQIKLMANQKTWPLTQLSMRQSQTENAPSVQLFQADKLDLHQLQELAENITSIPDTLKTNINAISPEGNLNQVLVRRELPTTGGDASFSASANFSELKTSTWKKIPAVEGLQGSVRFTPNAGDLQIDGNSLTVDAPFWFSHPFALAQYHGRIEWITQEDGLKIQATDMAFADANLGIRAQFGLWLPKQSTPYIQLLASFSEQDASHLREYVPTELLRTNSGLSKWLTEAFTAGDGVDGQMVLQGPLADFPFDEHTGEFEILVHVKNMLFNYKTGWPSISHLYADALFQGRSLDIQAPQAAIMDIPVSQIKAQIPDLAHAELDVTGNNIQTNMQNGLQFIAKSPLQKTIGEGLGNLALDGAMNLDLQLHIPLHQGKETSTVQGDVLISPNGKLSLPDWDIKLTDLSGAFTFTEDSLSAKQLLAKWLGQPVNITISTATNNPTILAQIKGHTTIAKIQKEYDLDFLKDNVSGETDYTASLQITKKAGRSQTVFSLDSDLQGVAISSPNILQKSANEKRATHAEIKSPEKGSVNVLVQYAKKISAAITFAQNKKKTWDLFSADIRLGENPAEFQTTPGLFIDGYLPQLAWTDVKEYVSPLFNKSSTKQALPLKVQKIDLTIDQLTAFGLTLLSANIQAAPKLNNWVIGINSPNIIGNLSIPNDLSRPIVGNFDRFRIIPSDAKTKSDINPGDIPPLNLRFKNFIYGDKPFGAVSLLTVPSKNILGIKNLSLDAGNTHLTASGRWQLGGQGRQQTTLSGNLQSDNIGAALKTWRVTGGVLGGAGTTDFALSWPSAAYDFSAKQLNGNFSLSFGKGSIINIGDSKEAEMGVGRILNLLSLQSIPRRLTLDFSDLVQKGFPFDEMKGDFSIQNGNAFTNNADLRGPIAKVEIKGRIGLGNKDYNLIMMTTPYLTSSLPVAATIVGGPIVGAATWLGNKVLGGVVNKIATSTYSVKGLWDNPVIEKVSGSSGGS